MNGRMVRWIAVVVSLLAMVPVATGTSTVKAPHAAVAAGPRASDPPKWWPMGMRPRIYPLAVTGQDGRIYVIGGWTGNVATGMCCTPDNTNEAYAPKQRTWT